MIWATFSVYCYFKGNRSQFSYFYPPKRIFTPLDLKLDYLKQGLVQDYSQRIEGAHLIETKPKPKP